MEANHTSGKRASPIRKCDVVKIDELIRTGYRDREIAEMFSVSPYAIAKIRTGRTFSDVTGRFYQEPPAELANTEDHWERKVLARYEAQAA